MAGLRSGRHPATTRIPKSLHRELKLNCVTAETSVMDFVTQAIEEKLARLGGPPVPTKDR
jgi:predicted HicB family RNase H-like nuclease